MPAVLGDGHAVTADVRYQAQVAARPVKGRPGDYKMLLVTSRETRRWIIPKGWPMKGRKYHEAAAQEALQEAGVSGHVHKWGPKPTTSALLTAASSTSALWSLKAILKQLDVGPLD